MSKLQDISLLKILGLGLTLMEYEEQVIGEVPHYEQLDLTFECTHCGQCCTRPGVVYLTGEDIADISTFLQSTPEDFKEKWLSESDGEWMIEVAKGEACPFLLEDLCVIHEVKPRQCQTYPFWPEIVGRSETWTNEKEACPGIDEGRDYSSKEVRRLLLGIDRTP